MNSVEFASMLSKNVYSVEFEKVDGSVRKMTCTRMMDKVPESATPKNPTTIDEETTAVPVFDLEISQWRSIRPTFVKNMEIA